MTIIGNILVALLVVNFMVLPSAIIIYGFTHFSYVNFHLVSIITLLLTQLGIDALPNIIDNYTTVDRSAGGLANAQLDASVVLTLRRNTA